MVPVNYLAILLAALSSMFVGFLWYGPLFGKEWSKLMGWSQKDLDKIKKEKGSEMNKLYAMQFLGSLVMAFVLAHALYFAKSYLGDSPTRGLETGFWNWLGFVAPITMGSILWEGKPLKLWLINNGNYLATLLVMGEILHLLK